MAWTDILQGSRQSLDQTLARNSQRREGRLSRLQDALGKLSAQRQQTSEREAGQEFAAGQQEALFGQQTSERVATQEYTTKEADEDVVRDLARLQDRQAYEEALMRLGKKYGIENLAIELQNDLKRIMAEGVQTRTTDEARADLDIRNLQTERGMVEGKHETQDGVTFEWVDPETKEFALAEMQEHQRRLSQLAASERVDGRTAWDTYRDMKDAVQGDLWVWSDDEEILDEFGQPTGRFGAYKRTNMPIEEAIQNFTDQANILRFSDGTIVPNMIAAFTTWAQWADQNPPSEEQDVTSHDSTVVNVGDERNATMDLVEAFNSFAARSYSTLGYGDEPTGGGISPPEGISTGTFGEGVLFPKIQYNNIVDEETNILAEFMRLLKSGALDPTDRQTMAQHVRSMNEPNVTDQLAIIREFLDSIR